MPTEAPTEEAAPALSIAESCRKNYSARIPLKNQMNATNIGGASSDWWDISRIYYEYKATFKVDAANAPKPLATAFFDAATASGGLGAGYAKMTPIIEGRLTSAEGDKVIKLLDAATTHFGRALTTIDSICASAGVTT